MKPGGPWGTHFPQSFSDALSFGQPAIVANDAGAAAHIAAWVSGSGTHLKGSDLFVQGPASRLLSPAYIPPQHDLETTLASRAWALVGTGWQGHLEREAMRICTERGIPCIAVLDHWVNYARRFEGVLAEERPFVVVTDSVALDIARATLPGFPSHMWPNELLSQFTNRVQTLAASSVLTNDGTPTLLWINEPFLKGSSATDPLDEPDFWGMLVRLLSDIIAERRIRRIIIRQHPSLPSSTSHRQPLRLENRVDIQHSAADTPLEVDVAEASLVLGLSSYALFLSASAGRETYSAANALGLASRLPSGLVPSWAGTRGASDR